jgi:hypothetical protein
MYAQANSHTVPICNISLRLLVLPAPEAGDFVELIPLYTPRKLTGSLCSDVVFLEKKCRHLEHQ